MPDTDVNTENDETIKTEPEDALTLDEVKEEPQSADAESDKKVVILDVSDGTIKVNHIGMDVLSIPALCRLAAKRIESDLGI